MRQAFNLRCQCYIECMFKLAVSLTESWCATVILANVSTKLMSPWFCQTHCDFKHALRVNRDKRGFYAFNKIISVHQLLTQGAAFWTLMGQTLLIRELVSSDISMSWVGVLSGGHWWFSIDGLGWCVWCTFWLVKVFFIILPFVVTIQQFLILLVYELFFNIILPIKKKNIKLK
jgi:hypothetical protein